MKVKIPTSRWSHFSGAVDENTIAALAGSIVTLKENAPEEGICLLLTSRGGSCQAGLSFYEMMRHLVKPKIETVALGEVCSIAVLLYLVGDTRFITKDSTLRIHDMSQTYSGDTQMRPVEIYRGADNLTRIKNTYAAILARHSNGKLTPKEVLCMMDKDTTFTAKEAVRMGLAHHILNR